MKGTADPVHATNALRENIGTAPVISNLYTGWKRVVKLTPRSLYRHRRTPVLINPLKPELNPICYLLALLGAHDFLHVSRIRVKLLTFRLLMS